MEGIKICSLNVQDWSELVRIVKRDCICTSIEIHLEARSTKRLALTGHAKEATEPLTK